MTSGSMGAIGSIGTPIFTDFSLQQAVNRALANLPPDHTFALVAHVDNDTGASLSAAVKVGDEWKLEASVVKGWTEPFRFGAEVVWSR